MCSSPPGVFTAIFCDRFLENIYHNDLHLQLIGTAAQNAIEQKAQRRARGGVNRVGEGKMASWDVLEAEAAPTAGLCPAMDGGHRDGDPGAGHTRRRGPRPTYRLWHGVGFPGEIRK